MPHSYIGLGWSSQVYPEQSFPGKGTNRDWNAVHAKPCTQVRGSSAQGAMWNWGSHGPGLLPYIECEKRLLSGVSWQITGVQNVDPSHMGLLGRVITSGHTQPPAMSNLDCLPHWATKIFSPCAAMWRRVGSTVSKDIPCHSSGREQFQKGHVSICLSRHELCPATKCLLLCLRVGILWFAISR